MKAFVKDTLSRLEGTEVGLETTPTAPMIMPQVLHLPPAAAAAGQEQQAS